MLPLQTAALAVRLLHGEARGFVRLVLIITEPTHVLARGDPKWSCVWPGVVTALFFRYFYGPSNQNQKKKSSLPSFMYFCTYTSRKKYKMEAPENAL